MPSNEFTSVIRSGIWIYLISFSNSLFGFLFWFIISSISGPSTVGYVSAIVSLSSLISSGLSFGVPVSMVKWIGQYRDEGDRVRGYFWTSLSFMLLAYTLVSLPLLYLGLKGINLMNYEAEGLVIISAFLISSISSAFASLFTGLIDTFPYLLASIAGNLAKLVVATYLVAEGFGWIGASLGYLMVNLVVDVAGITYAFRRISPPLISSSCLADLLRGGLPIWLPSIVAAIGQQLAVISLFGYTGAYESGLFYVAMTLSSFVTGMGSSLMSMMLPYLSGLEEGREDASSRGLRISLSLTLPIVGTTLIFPDKILSLLGSEYSSAWAELILMTVSNTLLLISGSITNLLYSRDMFTELLRIGLAMNVPRVVLYAVLVPRLGSIGAALSYLVGSMIGIIFTLKESRKVNFLINWGVISKILIIILLVSPLALPLRYSMVWGVGVLLAPALSVLGLMRARVMELDDIVELGRALIPGRYKRTAYKTIKPFLDVIYGL